MEYILGFRYSYTFKRSDQNKLPKTSQSFEKNVDCIIMYVTKLRVLILELRIPLQSQFLEIEMSL